MTATRAERRFVSWTIAAIVAVLFIAAVTSGCAAFAHVGDSTKVGTASALGSGVGMFFGPLFGVVGAAIGGFISYLFVSLNAAENREALLAQAQHLSTWDLIVSRAWDFMWLALVLLLVGLFFWGLFVLACTPRGAGIRKTITGPLSAVAALVKAVGPLNTEKKPKPRTPMAMPQEGA